MYSGRFTFLTLILAFNIILNTPAYSEDSYIPGSLIIKFKPDTPLIHKWFDSGKKCEFAEFKSILGRHTSKPYIGEELLKALRRRQNHSFQYNISSLANSLSRICIINFSSPIDPVIASRKISSHVDVEYAEPAPIREIVEIPDDPEIDLQYYLINIEAYDAWDYLDSGRTVLIGIVDTGVDYEHEDLAGNIYVNPGEDGIDAHGNSKRSNGIDDDNNGFVDDWRGWDFVSSDSASGQDNDPYPGHPHGTHVAGITSAVTNNGIGIAGVAKAAKILPVKIAKDNPLSTSVYNSYEGILYAAIAGADVINCSWGGTNKSMAEQEVISAVEQLGAAVVAAAGNNGSELAFFPASYKNIISVAAVDGDDRKTGFSNYDYSVDVSAPGKDIYSTVPLDMYEKMSGTSMASPVAAGVAAIVRMKFPDYTPLQAAEHLKATADDIDANNSAYRDKIGKGRVNALSAVRAENPKSIILTDYQITDENDDGVIDKGELVEISITFLNVLSPIQNVEIEAHSNSIFNPELIESTFFLGDMSSGEKKSISPPIVFTVPDEVPLDYQMEVKIHITDRNGYTNLEVVKLTICPSYRTMNANNISVTFNSAGNIGFNDYPHNLQGEGFSYKNSLNILYEGSLMVGVSENRVSNVARGANQMYKDDSFRIEDIFIIDNDGILARQEGTAGYYDSNDSSEVGVDINQIVYQFDDPGREDFIIVIYDIVNTSGKFIDSLYAGLYFDWDIGPAGSNNKAYFDNSENFGFIKNVLVDTLPQAGVLLLSSQKTNYFAIDNDGTSDENPGVWDGFDRDEKWRMLSGGIARRESNITDASIVIGGGPITMRNGDTVRVAFSIFAGENIGQLQIAARESRNTAKFYNIADGNYSSIPKIDSLFKIYPNPVYDDILNIDFTISDATNLTLDIFDILGNKAATISENERLLPDYYTRSFSISGIASGRYFIRFRTNKGVQAEPFTIAR